MIKLATTELRIRTENITSIILVLMRIRDTSSLLNKQQDYDLNFCYCNKVNYIKLALFTVLRRKLTSILLNISVGN